MQNTLHHRLQIGKENCALERCDAESENLLDRGTLWQVAHRSGFFCSKLRFLPLETFWRGHGQVAAMGQLSAEASKRQPILLCPATSFVAVTCGTCGWASASSSRSQDEAQRKTLAQSSSLLSLFIYPQHPRLPTKGYPCYRCASALLYPQRL